MGNTTVTICEETEEIILHPVTYAKDKVKKKGLSSLFLPHCFTPAWVLSPECYAWKWVKKEDAWEEVKKTFTCKDYTFSVEEAFKKWLWGMGDPVPGFHIIPDDLTALFGVYIGAAYEVADPLPKDVKDELKYLANKDRYQFTVTNIEQTRWLRSDHVLAKRIWPGRDIAAITYYNLIIMSPYGLELEGCDEVALWAHELVHVHQYNQLGWDNFLSEYLKEGVNGYDNMLIEIEARNIENFARRDCLIRHADVAIKPRRIMALNEKMRQMMLAGLLSIKEDRIMFISELALQRLKADIPNLTFTAGETAIVREKITAPVDRKRK